LLHIFSGSIEMNTLEIQNSSKRVFSPASLLQYAHGPITSIGYFFILGKYKEAIEKRFLISCFGSGLGVYLARDSVPAWERRSNGVDCLSIFAVRSYSAGLL